MSNIMMYNIVMVQCHYNSMYRNAATPTFGVGHSIRNMILREGLREVAT